MLVLSLLGKPTIQRYDRPLSKNPPKKAQALLFFLCLSDSPHTREYLATLLWSAKNDLNGLAGAIHKIRPTPLYQYWQIEKDAISLDGERITVDARRFEEVAKNPNSFLLDDLMSAGRLYRGSFLDGFRLPDRDGSTEGFVDWVTVMDSHFEQLALDLFAQIIERCCKRGLYADALPWVEKQLAIDDYREDFHRQKMGLLRSLGRQAQAITHCHHLCQLLELELDDLESATVDLYQQLLTEQETVSNKVVAPFQTPRLPTYFMGRTKQIAHFGKQLTQTNDPCYAIVGMGGIGKTTLATAVSHQLRDHFKDGVLWAHSADTQNMATALQHWGQLFGREWRATDLDTLAPLFRDLIADKHILIVLDDVSHVGKIREILPSTPGCALLITTRDHTVAHALNANLLQLDVLTRTNSLQLLHYIIGHDRADAEQAACETICEQLEDLPLAVEILAQRIRSRPRLTVRSFADNLANIQSRLGELELGDRAVRASIELSWRLLNVAQQTHFRVLAVFNGRRFAAPAIAHITDTPLRNTERILDGLLNLSLLTPIEENQYRQHGLLADFAHERAAEQGDEGLHAAQTRMVAHYAQFAHANQTDYDALRPEWVNLHAAIQTAHDLQQWQAVLDLTQTLTPAWFTRARYTDARQAYTLAITAAEALNDSYSVAITAFNWAKTCLEQDELNEARKKLLIALEIFSSKGEEQLLAETMLYLGRISIDQIEYEEAHQWLMDSRQLAHKLEDMQLQAKGLHRLAHLYFRNRELKKSEKCCLTILSSKDCDQRTQIRTLRLLADISINFENYNLASKYCKSALDLAYQHGNIDEIATALHSSLTIFVRLQDYKQVDSLGRKCIRLSKKMGSRKLEALTLYELSISHWYQEHHAKALDYLDEGLTILRRIDNKYNYVLLLAFRGKISESLGEVQAACKEWQKALDYAIPQQHRLTSRIQDLLKQYCKD